ncbi:BTAD domain-containing putative transcriptional regulator [Catenulispora sp. GP43]|uniref:AfsR/SARP family transcriptional regulator n=1 Tax=Catenulispora sp. GP43 TaxID=3156263 RepID=UPI0035170BB9
MRAWRTGTELSLGPPAQRALFGLLVLADGQALSRTQLIDALWAGEPPSGAVNVIQTYVKRLRRLLEPARPARASSALLPTVGSGYVLRPPGDGVDLVSFRNLVGTAGDAAVDQRGVAALLGKALGLWRGAPLADIPALAGHPTVVALARERHAALGGYADAMIATGAAAEALPLLAQDAADHPLDEAAQTRLIRAYHAAGQRDRAFAVYHDARHRLADELGLDPGPELAAAHYALLRVWPPAARQAVRPAAGSMVRRPPGPFPGQASRGRVPLGQAGLGRAGLGQAALGQAGLGQAGLDQAEFGQAGLGQAGIDQAGFDQAGFGQAGFGQASPGRPAPPVRTGSVPAAPQSPVPVPVQPPVPVPAPVPVLSPVPVPAQLPADVFGFVGRTGELAKLSGQIDAGGTAVAIAVVSGTAGVGKTALAVHWAHRVRDRFPDGQLYVNLRGFDPTERPVAPADALAGFLEALGEPGRRIPSEVDARAALLRSLLANRRMLLVLDNVREAEQVLPLLPSAPTCHVVITSRSQLQGLIATTGAFALSLDLLSAEESRELLAQRLSPDRVRTAPAAVDDIAEHCARLPLALAIVAARAALRPRFALDAIAAQLRVPRNRLDLLHGGDSATDLRAVFSWSYRALEERAQRLFALLGLHQGSDISVPAAASLAGVPRDEAEQDLAQLSSAHLLTEHALGRFTFHDLLRAYAVDRSRTLDPAEQDAAVHRVLDHYLHTTYAAAVASDPSAPIVLPLADPLPAPPPDIVVDAPADPEQAREWLLAEYHVLRPTVQWAGEAGYDAHAWQLAWTLSAVLDRQRGWPERPAAGYSWTGRVEPARVHVPVVAFGR